MAVFDYEPTDHSELRLWIGDLLCVDSTDMCGWLEGRILRYNGWESGWFPSTFVVNCDRWGRPLEAFPEGVDEERLRAAMARSATPIPTQGAYDGERARADDAVALRAADGTLEPSPSAGENSSASIRVPPRRAGGRR